MVLKVIGAGFGRTGTNTLREVLGDLGFGPCYHMYEVFPRPEHVDLWREAADGNLPDWDKLFDGFTSGVDWPLCNFWRELSEYYPDAKIILSERESTAWFNSINKTILETFRAPQNPDDERYALRQMTTALIYRNVFGENIEDRDHVTDVYERHNAEVKAAFSDDRLLVFDPKQGWEPLCGFLDVPIPDHAFPRTNTTKQFRERLGLES